MLLLLAEEMLVLLISVVGRIIVIGIVVRVIVIVAVLVMRLCLALMLMVVLVMRIQRKIGGGAFLPLPFRVLLLALVVVSAVVKVLEAIRKSVVSGSEAARASAMCVPSMLDTKWRVMSLAP